MMNRFVIIGTGYPVKLYADKIIQLQKAGWKVLAFQECYPHCLELGIHPNYWTWADPNSAFLGLEHLLKTPGVKNVPEIVIPDFLKSRVDVCRTYIGTSPLARREGAWRDYVSILELLPHTAIKATTIKRLKEAPFSESSLRNTDILGKDAKTRFAYHKLICGTAPYDSESVIGDQFKWGLESKLSSFALPMAYQLGAKEVAVCGFGMKGSRFFSDDGRMPFNDQTQKTSVHQIPLDFIKRWTIEWPELHKMRIMTLESQEHGMLHEVMPIMEF